MNRPTPGPFEARGGSVREMQKGRVVAVCMNEFWSEDEACANALLLSAAHDLSGFARSALDHLRVERACLIEGCTIRGDLSTLTAEDKPFVEELDELIAMAESAIAKSERRAG